ncbi:hypothetical protein NV226_00875 [Mycoplasma iguanae]|uniref:Uncharacterized protein n=1 Tax=Mycoplasma iguanae TaxID=292461 RepID=A0ABY5RAS2_9MOLU|nr:hypothetical protein [Mycoplasma iguanae]UVD81847.1 hypothetical protein NV226_00875 [Mycoplasma iguanae]
MSFPKKIFLTWLTLYLLGSVISIVLMFTINNKSILLGWIWSGIGNIFFIFPKLFFLNEKYKNQSEAKNSFNKMKYLIFTYTNSFIQILLALFLIFINYWANGNWSNVLLAPLNIISFVVGSSIPMITFLIAASLSRKE